MVRFSLRSALESDAHQIQSIYSYYVLNSAATLELIPPSKKQIANRILSVISEGYPFIVAIEEPQILGFSFAKMYYGREGFKPTVESSVYVDRNKHGLGIGYSLMEKLILECSKTEGVKNIIAYIGGGEKNIASINLHKKLGFQMIGVYKNIGYKDLPSSKTNYHDMAGLQLVL